MANTGNEYNKTLSIGMAFGLKRKNRKLPDKAEKNKRLKHVGLGLFSIVVLAGLGFAGYKLLDPQTLPLKRIIVTGQMKKVSAGEVEKLVTPYMNQGFFRANVTDIKNSVKTLPWVYDLSVRRMWPDTLHVTVIEQKAMAEWKNGGLINEHGERFNPEKETYPAGLPVLNGMNGDELLLASTYREMNGVLQGIGFSIEGISLDERRAMKLELNNGLEILLGKNGNNFTLRRFVQVYPEVLGNKIDKVSRIDLRYANGFAIRWVKQSGQSTANSEG